jgi:hypothetical protein
MLADLVLAARWQSVHRTCSESVGAETKLTGTVIAVIGRSTASVSLAIARAVVVISALALAWMLVGLMVADDAAGAGPEHPVMTGKVPRDTANNGALQTPLGRGGR